MWRKQQLAKHTYMNNYLDYLLPEWHSKRAEKQVVANLNSYNKHLAFELRLSSDIEGKCHD